MAGVIFKQTFSIDDIDTIVKRVIELSKGCQTFCFYGDLGAGKTTLISHLASALFDINSLEISSPTFSYLHEYDQFVHFDLYRITSHTEFKKMGFDELIDEKVSFIEWPDRIDAILPEKRVEIHLEDLGPETRQITVELYGS